MTPMPMPRPAAIPETTGPWKPTWSPGHTRPGLPPLTVVYDPDDDYAFMAAALTAHTPALGRTTVHPTPVASAPASLAHDLLRSMGKHLPVAGSEDATFWTTNAKTAWRLVAAWISALHIHHIIITRAHRISPRHFEHLFALRELTNVRQTLLCHGPLPPAPAAALAVLPHDAVRILAAARHAVNAPAPAPAPPPPAGQFAWWEADRQFPPRPGEPCFLLPTRRAPGRGEIEAAARHLGRTVLPLPAAGHFPPEPDEHTTLLAHRLHARIAHPIHAAALAVRIFAGYSPEHLQLPPARETPSWAVGLFQAARCFAELDGRGWNAPLLYFGAGGQAAVTEAAHACGLHEHQAAGPRHRPAATTPRSGQPAAARPVSGSTQVPGRAA